MMAAIKYEQLRGVLTEHEPMSRHTSWRVGGTADRFYQPADIEDLVLLLQQLPDDEPVTWVGLGSNLLVRDGGIRGTVIATSGMLNEMEQIDAQDIRVEAGVACAKVARFSVRCGLRGGEFLAGIPGTMGGALAMNAGAFGNETWECVESVETLDKKGGRHLRTTDEYRVDYRQVSGPEDEWFVAARLKFLPGDSEAGSKRIKQLLAQRGETQPTQQASCGSVFRNPPDDHAARLIEACGLKGTCVGGACVSDKHANFIVNMGNAKAADIEALINKVSDTVQRERGIQLVPEVHMFGEKK